MEELHIEIQRQKLELDKSAAIRQQKFEEMFLCTQQEQEKLFELSNRDQNVENENTFFQNAIWSAIESFPYTTEGEIIFALYLDLYNCVNWTDFKKVCLLLRKLGTVEHTKFVNYI